jgi:hypothetical protein
MAVGLFVTSQEEFTNFLGVACQFAKAFGQTLMIYVSSKEDGLLAKNVRAKIKSRDEGDGNKDPRIRLKPLGEEDCEARLLEEARSLNKLLIPYTKERDAELAKLGMAIVMVLHDGPDSKSPKCWTTANYDSNRSKANTRQTNWFSSERR